MSNYLVTIDSIKEIRLGKTTERLREHAHQFQNESLFSIIYTNGNNQYASLDLVASSADEANIWVTGLSCLISGQGAPPSPAGKLNHIRLISFPFNSNTETVVFLISVEFFLSFSSQEEFCFWKEIIFY